jgi:hypothetical protein
VHCLCPGVVSTNIHKSERNRPKELQNAPQQEQPPSEEYVGFMERLYGSATKPPEVAELVLQAIVDRRFWIQTDGYYRDAIKARHRSIENDTDPPARGSVISVYL